MNKDELGKLYPVALSEYDGEWPLLFEKEKGILSGIWGMDLRIEHIGSTAVAGMLAKPTIDILLEKPHDVDDERIIATMARHGYVHMREQDRHLMFVKGYTPAGLGNESYHVHMGPLSLDFLWDRVFFRDYLSLHPGEARIYEKLKKKLASECRHDREAYTEGKAEYIRMITEKAKKGPL